MKGGILFIAMMLSFLLIACSSKDIPQFKRSDCIVEVELSWSVGGAERVKSLNLLADLIDGAEVLDYQGPFPAGFSYRRDHTRLYLQYYSECDQRVVNTEKLFLHILNSALEGKVKYKVNDDKVDPAAETIMLKGPAWID